MSKRLRSLAPLALLVLLGVVAWWAVSRPTDPGAKFSVVTGRALPTGVRATAYASELDDNLLRRTHYWLLSGAPADLRRVTAGTGFEPSLGDARAMVPDLKSLVGVPLTGADVTDGYEWEGDHDRWFCIFADGGTALYVQ